MNVVHRILKYLKRFPGRGLLYKKCDEENAPDILGHVDADWASSIVDRQSTSGYVLDLRVSDLLKQEAECCG